MRLRNISFCLLGLPFFALTAHAPSTGMHTILPISPTGLTFPNPASLLFHLGTRMKLRIVT